MPHIECRALLQFLARNPEGEQQTELNHLFACGFRQFTLAFTDMRPDIAKMDDHEEKEK